MGVIADSLDDAGLHRHRLAEGGHLIVQPMRRRRDALVAFHYLADAARELPAKLLAQLIDAKVDALRLTHQSVDLAERLAKPVELREVDAAEVLALIDPHLDRKSVV